MQAVQLVGCGVIGAALAVLLVSGLRAGWRCGGRGDLLRRRGAGGVIERAGPSLIRTDPAGDPVQWAGSRASGGKMGKRKRPGQTARRALLLWPLVCTGGNGSGWVRPGAGGWRYTPGYSAHFYPGRRAAPDPLHRFRLQRFRLVVLHPGRFWPFAGGVRILHFTG